MNRIHFCSTVIVVIGIFLSSSVQAQSIADLDGNEIINGREIFAFVARMLAYDPEPATGTQTGWIAPLVGQNPTYGVSGNAVVTSATSIRLENFSYLNNGPDVFIYLIAAEGEGDFTQGEGATGLPILTLSNNPAEPYSNETLDLDLPEGVTTQPYTHISIWCRQFGADFGSGRFAPTKTLR